MSRANAKAEIPVFSVSDLTYLIKGHMESVFSDVIVAGEISNYSNPKSGHHFFTLKDEGAQLSSVIWRGQMARSRFELKNGLAVICRGHIEVYAPHGKYQFIVTKLEPAGIGALELAFRQLHEKLSQAGLFDPARKKPLPKCIRRVIVVTSATGAAFRDFLNILRKHTNRVEVILVPSSVQGETAAQEIASAIEQANRLWGSDQESVLALIRGGGSMEDLWAFNEEVAVRAVAASRLPVVTGIGHEIDTSLCDLAADLPARTPTEAADRIAPDDTLLAEQLDLLQQRLEQGLDRRFSLLDDSVRRLENSVLFTKPEIRLIDSRFALLTATEQHLTIAMDMRVAIAMHELGRYAGQLQALSPLGVLARGYSLTQTENGAVVCRTEQVKPGQTLRTRLAHGEITSVVTHVNAVRENDWSELLPSTIEENHNDDGHAN
ncbi:MAG: exodeoxyribonuclease VII large subunit [Planctomycetia bacterium]|nr:exodeoxyribonuclease VII large subunit [Planctomycetia bacterium]